MFSPSPQEIFVLILIALVLFGAKRLPDLARSLGQGIREFKKSVSGISEEPAEHSNSDKTSQS
jgi:sec-independent protein translocase protein TatA